uniref:Ig-like domain-containing protein n=1 Tax=Branchiostoma floridae TaxID=7739 RepID=C3YAB3_BRAFL|eukprot:XP_002606651.1 hypothetical protein BRAFLDRAFT_91744 [Branchiostoma floridae]
MFTGLGNLEILHLVNNEINNIQTGTFNSTPQLTTLHLDQNKLATLRSDMFTGLQNLETLHLSDNEINDIQTGTFSSMPQLRNLYLEQNRLTLFKAEAFANLPLLRNLRLFSNNIETFPTEALSKLPSLSELQLQDNQMETLTSTAYNRLSSLSTVNIDNNPWQCDCRMLPFRQRMTGSPDFEYQITCEGPSKVRRRHLRFVNPIDLICEEPTILRFGRGDNNTVIEGQTLYLVCEASGIPTPDITVTLPSGLNVTVESGGRVTVDVNGTITITNVTAEDAGLYVCTVSSSVGSTFATLVVNVQLKDTTTSAVSPVTTVTALAMTNASNKPSADSEAANTSEFSLPVLVGSVSGAAVGTVLLVTISIILWQKKRSKSSYSGSNSRVVFYKPNTVTVSAHDLARHDDIVEDEEYTDVDTPSRRPYTGTGQTGYDNVVEDEDEYVDVDTPSQRPLSGIGHERQTDLRADQNEEEYVDVLTPPQRPHFGRSEHEYEVVPPSLPPRNNSGPLADNQTVSAAVHGADNPQVAMDEDGYQSVTVDPRSHKYKNSQVVTDAEDTLVVPPVILYDRPRPNRYQNSQMIAAAKDAVAVPQVISYENDDEPVTGKEDPQSHKYAIGQVTADAEDALAVSPVVLYKNDDDSVSVKDDLQCRKYENSDVIAAAKDALVVPQVILYENDDETVTGKDDPHISVVSTLANHPSLRAYLFRNYNLPAGAPSHYHGDCCTRVWEAVRASSAAPGYFEEFKLGQGIHQDGGVLVNNPCAVAIHESKLLWPDTPLQCVVSVGMGRYEPDNVTSSSSLNLRTKLSKVVESATNTEGLGNLQELELHNNEISDVHTGAFTGLGNLQALSLGNNKISGIQTGTFTPTSQLKILFLYENKLTSLRSGMFTGLENLQHLELQRNKINDIQARTFTSTSQLRSLVLHENKLTSLRSGMFTGLGNLEELSLNSNEISDIQTGTFSPTKQLRILRLDQNRLEVLNAEMFAVLSSISDVDINNNPWQCDCRIVPFRQLMSGSTPWWSDSFENQITCDGPISRNLRGPKLKDMRIEDLICEEPAILRFGKSDNNTVVEGQTLRLVCKTSGIPTPDITVTLPSGQNVTVESGGRVTVDMNGTITITNATAAADAGLYVCIATSPVGSIFAALNIQMKVTTTSSVAPVTSPIAMADPSNKPESSATSGYRESTPSLSILSIPVLIGSVCGPVAVTLLVGTIILTIWFKMKTQNPPSGPPNPVVFSSAAASVTITGHDQTGQGGPQAAS